MMYLDLAETDLNLTQVCGTLAAPAEHRSVDPGTPLLRLLLAVRSDHPRRRVDVLPIVVWDPPDSLSKGLLVPGTRVWAGGSVQRRFWDGTDGRRSRIEIVATHATVVEPAEAAVRADIGAGPG